MFSVIYHEENFDLQGCDVPDNTNWKEEEETNNYRSFGGGGPEKSGGLYESFWIQLASLFLFWS